ncbi:MAG: hypothetical protein WC211_02420 [Dehalococcoidia bacterium]
MFTPLTPLILALLAFLGPVHITLVPEGQVTAYDPAHRTAENPTGAYVAVAKTSCEAGAPQLQFTAQAIVDPVAVTHELLHAVDCVDDATFDGSPDPTACAEVPNDCLHAWVYWALRHPDEAAAMLDRMPRAPRPVRDLEPVLGP